MLRTFSNTLLQRRRQTELMDSPNLEQTLHDAALAGLRRINRWSRTGAAIWSSLKDLIPESPAQQEFTILDIACGSGDQALWLARRMQQHGMRHRIHGVDISQHGRCRCHSAGSAGWYLNGQFSSVRCAE
ncbi:MAG UNVERIFIED_CONTAM: hypothetical protein LVR18_45370 [Planctomycetaceae bacterium]